MSPAPRSPLGACPGWPGDVAARYVAAGYWTGETFDAFLADRCARFAGRTAVVAGNVRWTYRDLERRVDVLAARLAAAEVTAGDRVVVQVPNVADYVAVVFAAFRLAALPVFALPSHREHEIGSFCRLTDAAAYVVAPHFGGTDYAALAATVVAGLDRPPAVVAVGEDEPDLTAPPGRPPRAAADPAAPAFLQLSGGSTGEPKLIPRTHRDYLYSVRASAEICGLTPDSVYLVALPAAHNFPMSSPGILGVLHAGGTVVMAPDPGPATVFGLIERERVTIAAAVPPLALAWLAAARRRRPDLSSLRVLQVGGAKLSAQAAARVEPELGCRLQQVFGMAEGLVNYTRLDDGDETVTTTQGRPISPDDELRIVDDDGRDVPPGTAGHLLTRGPYTIRGYYAAPEHDARSFTADGFYRTGDVVRLVTTPDGEYLVVEGRSKDQINRGGDKIAAEEVENQLLAHDAVHDAAVVAVPDPYLGERTCAFVVLATDRAGPAPAGTDLKRFLRDRGLAAFKVPDRVEFVDAFPVTNVGKTSKTELRRAIAARLAQPPR